MDCQPHWLDGRTFDAVMNYPFAEAALAMRERSVERRAEALQRVTQSRITRCRLLVGAAPRRGAACRAGEENCPVHLRGEKETAATTVAAGAQGL